MQRLEMSTLLKLEISSFRRVEISKQTNAKPDELNSKTKNQKWDERNKKHEIVNMFALLLVSVSNEYIF